MSHNYTSTGCPAPEVLPRDPVPFFQNGNINFKAHDVGWICCAFFTLIASSTSIWLISKHLAFFYHPTEQRHIVRLLFMPVIYAVCSFLSYFFYRQALYFQLVRDCYEALVIASTFFLLLSYLSNPPPSPETPIPKPYATKRERDARLRASVRDLHLKNWMWPLGWWKWRPAGGGPGEGEAFLWWMRVCIGQYVLVRPLSTLASVIGEATGYYCLASWSPKFVHIWSSAAISVSVTVAMYCVLQLFMPLKEQLKPYSPVLKFLCVKSVVFLTFWQDFLVTVGVIKNRQYWSADEIVIGLAALLSCFEMVLFALLHVRAFTYLPYRALATPLAADHDPEKAPVWDPLASSDAPSPLKRPKHPHDSTHPPPRRPDGSPMLQQTRRWPALLRALDLRDLFVEIKEETRFVVRGGEVGEEAWMRRKREEARKAVTDAERPVLEKAEEEERYSWEEEEAIGRDEADLRHGDLAYMPLTYGSNVQTAASSAKPARGRPEANRPPSQPWKDSLRHLRSNPRLVPSFLRPSEPDEEMRATQYRPYEPAFVPFLPPSDSVLLPPPHRLQTPQLRPPANLVPPVLSMASEASKRSQGLPPGAAAPSR
ncbi:Transmembrane protein 184 [Rhodotorula toruloides]|nr:Transmembrane protein 184 [Rhodotorula toruloides]